jgi:hypothetical protein
VPRTQPTPEVLAAIVAAVEATWPRPVVVAEERVVRSPWRWSGRWWASSRPVAADRRRPGGL